MASPDVWGFYNQRGLRRSDLSEVQLSVMAICDLRQEVSSGGFDVYFRYSGGDSAEQALLGLADALGPEWEQLLQSAKNLFGPYYPVDTNERRVQLDALKLGKQLDALDRQFYALEASTDADARLTAILGL